MTPYDWQHFSRVPVPPSAHRQTLMDDPLHRKPFPWITLALVAAVLTTGAIYLWGRG